MTAKARGRWKRPTGSLQRWRRLVPGCLAVSCDWTVTHTCVVELIRDTCCSGGWRSLWFWENGVPRAAIFWGLILPSPPLSRFQSSAGGMCSLMPEKGHWCQPPIGTSTWTCLLKDAAVQSFGLCAPSISRPSSCRRCRGAPRTVLFCGT